MWFTLYNNIFVTMSCVRAVRDVEVIEVPTLAIKAFGKYTFVRIVLTATTYFISVFVKRDMLPDAGYRPLQ
jgi:hypothetical protein